MNQQSIIPPTSINSFNINEIKTSLLDENKGYHIIDNFLLLDEEVLDHLYHLAQQRVSKEACLTDQPSHIRSDLTCDIDTLSHLQDPCIGIESICCLLQFYCCQELNKIMNMKLYCRERPQLAYYPGGYCYYCRHFDNPRYLINEEDENENVDETGNNRDENEDKNEKEDKKEDNHLLKDNKRRITFVYYLNKEWNTEQPQQDQQQQDDDNTQLRSEKRQQDDVIINGQLKIYEPNSSATHLVEPIFNRLVIFLSDIVEHEVLPTTNNRYALTVWLSEKDIVVDYDNKDVVNDSYQELFDQLSQLFYPV